MKVVRIFLGLVVIWLAATESEEEQEVGFGGGEREHGALLPRAGQAVAERLDDGLMAEAGPSGFAAVES